MSPAAGWAVIGVLAVILAALWAWVILRVLPERPQPDPEPAPFDVDAWEEAYDAEHGTVPGLPPDHY
jgi:hypothetical protein